MKDRDRIKMAKEQGVEFTFCHKYIKDTPARGMILTEHLLNPGRRPQTFKRVRKSPHNWVGQKKKGKKKKREKGTGTGSVPLGGNCARGKLYCTLGSRLTGREINPDRGEALEPWRSTATSL